MKERRNKKWNETKTNDSWSIFKIMGEFVEGYEKLSAIRPCISIFGSARTKPEHKYYKLAEDISEAIIRVLEYPKDLVEFEVFNVGDNSMNHSKEQI